MKIFSLILLGLLSPTAYAGPGDNEGEVDRFASSGN